MDAASVSPITYLELCSTIRNENFQTAFEKQCFLKEAGMDYIRSFDIRLQKDVYYAGETISGHVYLENVDNFKVKGIRVVLRGKAHAEWKIMKSGERRTVKDDQYLLDDKAVIWGKDKHETDDSSASLPILPRGMHQFGFNFQLPQSALPCSFESKAGTIRYYIKVVIDIPYASPPQGVKYFTIIGPYIDCMDEKYLTPMVGEERKTDCCLCLQRGPLSLRVSLERTAYACGEVLRVRADIDNKSSQTRYVRYKLLQFVEYFIDKGVLGVNKSGQFSVFEHRSARIGANASCSQNELLPLPVVPPTLIGVCRLLQIYYVLKVSLENEKQLEDVQMEFPLTVATVPFRIANSQQQPVVAYECCSSEVEGGQYVSPEFQLGQVYDGVSGEDQVEILYRPVYVRVPDAASTAATARSDDRADDQQPTTSAAAAAAAAADDDQNWRRRASSPSFSNDTNARAGSPQRAEAPTSGRLREQSTVTTQATDYSSVDSSARSSRSTTHDRGLQQADTDATSQDVATPAKELTPLLQNEPTPQHNTANEQQVTVDLHLGPTATARLSNSSRASSATS